MTSTPSTRPNPVATRAFSKEVILKVYSLIEFTEEEQAFLLKKGYRSATSILQAYDSERINDLECEDFPPGSCDVLTRLGAYLKWSKEAHGDFRVLETFDPEVFEVFDPEKVRATPTKSPSTDYVPRTMTLKLSEFPHFNGKSHDWPKFYEKFTAVTSIYGLGYLLEERYDHSSRFENDEKYRNHCILLFNALKNSCAGGYALPRVNAFKLEQDGYTAFHSLYNHYHAKGNAQEYANECMQKLLNLTLTYNSAGAMEAYLSKFEELVLELQDKDPLTEGQKKTFLLNGIKDRNYNALKTICHSAQYEFEKTLLELCREAQEIAKTQPRRNNNAKSNDGKTKKKNDHSNNNKNSEPKVTNDYRLP